MIILTGSPTSLYDLGAIGLMFILAAGSLKIAVFMIKNKLENGKKEPCKVYQEGICPFASDWKKLIDNANKLFDVHCGIQGIGKNGVPRWYLPDDFINKIDDIHRIVSKNKDRQTDTEKRVNQ